MQQSLFGRDMRAELMRAEHGGAVRRHRRKLERPVSTRRPMHVVLTRAEGPFSLRVHQRAVRDTLRAMARRFGIRIYDFANVGSHLHLLVRVRRREAFQGFLRSFAGIVARKVMGAKRGRPAKRVIMKRGWISRKTTELNLNKIENLGIDQGLLGRMLNYGTVSVVGTGGTKESFKYVAQPLEFRKAVQDLSH